MDEESEAERIINWPSVTQLESGHSTVLIQRHRKPRISLFCPLVPFVLSLLFIFSAVTKSFLSWVTSASHPGNIQDSMENVNQHFSMPMFFICPAFYIGKTSASVSFKRQFLKVLIQPQERYKVMLGTGYLGFPEVSGLLKIRQGRLFHGFLQLLEWPLRWSDGIFPLEKRCWPQFWCLFTEALFLWVAWPTAELSAGRFLRVLHGLKTTHFLLRAVLKMCPTGLQ